jgi:hypothetical protein
MRKFSSFIILATSVLLVSCSAEQKLKRRITGQWTIASYSEQNVTGNDGTSENVGTINFERNGKGSKKITGIPWRRSLSEGTDFRWQNSANTVTIFDQSTSIFAKSWIITVNKKKRQEWKSTDRGNVQTLQLRK